MGRPRASFMAIRARLPASSGTISSASPLPYGLELPQHSLRALDGFLSLSPTFRLFGANAAWLRLAVISHNVMTALKRLALPADLLTARPKRLRFLIFNTPGRLVHHARRTVLRLAITAQR